MTERPFSDSARTKLLPRAYHAGRISGLATRVRQLVKLDRTGKFLADSESGSIDPSRKDWRRGIYIGRSSDGKVFALIPDPDVNAKGTSAAEGVAVDAAGNIYGAEVGPRRLMRYVKQ